MLVIGAVEISELVLLNLVHQRCGRILIANRTVTRASELAGRFGAEPVPLERIADALPEIDLQISCTASAENILAPPTSVALLRSVKVDPCCFWISPCRATSIPRSRACALDLYARTTWQRSSPPSRVDRSRELARAEAIAQEESDKFRDRQRSLDVVPAIAALRKSAEEIRAGELRRVEGKLGRLSPRERQLVESLTAQIMNKCLDEPTVRMKHAAGPAGPAYAGAVQHLFGPAEEPR